MRIDPAEARTMERTATGRRPWLQLLSALLELAGGKAELLRHCERPWASVTFSGSRHTVTIAFSGIEAIDAGETFIAALPEHEFAIARQLVADASVVSVEHTHSPTPAMSVEVEILLLDDT